MSSETRLRGARLAVIAAVGALFVILALVLVAVALVKPLDHDEQMYVAAGALLRRGAGLPYRDYPFFQMPDLELVYAAVFLGADQLLFAGRLLNTGAALAGLAVLFALVWRGCPARSPWPRLAVGAAAILLVVGNGPFTYASGLGWNHDLPVLLTLGALVCFLRAGDGRSRLVFAGALLGLAVGTRIAFAPALAPFLVAAALPPPAAPAPDPSPAPARRAIQLRAPGALLAGVVLGLAPSGVLAVLAPARFLFDNVAYHFWNAAYWQASAPGAPERLTDKLGYLRDLLLAQPACLALGLLYALVALPPLAWAVARGRLGAHRPLALAAALVPCLLLGALVPSPTWYQYFYAPVPFMALAVALGLGTIWGIGGARARLRRVGAGVALGIGAALALVNGVQVYSGYLRDAGFPQPAGWVPLQVHQTGLEIRRLLDTSGSGRGRAQVLTLLPLYPLEGGLAIYPALASGPFAWRVAPLLPSDQRPALQVAGAPDLAALVGPAGPAAVLTGSEGALDAPLTAYALAHDYHPARLPDGLTLWMK